MVFAPILTSFDHADAASYSRSRGPSSSMRSSGSIRSNTTSQTRSTATSRPNATRPFSAGSTATRSYSSASANTRMGNAGIGSRFWGGRWGWRGGGFGGFGFWGMWFFNGIMLWSMFAHPFGFGYPYMWFHAGIPYMWASMWYIWWVVPGIGWSFLLVLLMLVKISLFFWFARLAYYKFATWRIRLGILFAILSILAISF